jgi:hypothetical protein
VDSLAITLSELGSLALIGWIVIAVIQLRLQYLQRREEIVLRLYELTPWRVTPARRLHADPRGGQGRMAPARPLP